jgi:MipA family protein
LKLPRLIAVALVATACHAWAADPAGAAASAPAGLHLPQPAVETATSVKRPLWELGIGVAGLSLPDYRGSDQSSAYLLPLPYVVYRGTFLKADRDGTRALLLDSQRVKVDVSVAASTPARSRDNLARQGMPNLPGTFEVGPDVNIALFGSARGHHLAALAEVGGRHVFAAPEPRPGRGRRRLERGHADRAAVR